MLVEDVGLAAVDSLVGVVFGADGGHAFEGWVFRLDGVEELGETGVVTSGAIEPIFVADLDVFQLEGGAVAVFGAFGVPTWWEASPVNDVFSISSRASWT